MCQEVGVTSLHVLREFSSHCGPGHHLKPSLLRQDLKDIWESQFWARPSSQEKEKGAAEDEIGSITDSTDMNQSKLQKIVKDTGAWHATAQKVTESQPRLVTKQQGKASYGTVCQGGGREGTEQQVFSLLSLRP